jgi:hypothetical protein
MAPPTRAVHAACHEESFRGAVQAIDKAVNRALISAKKYDKVGVISLRWENDDLNLGPIEIELLDVFKNKFHFDTDTFLIPARTRRDTALAVQHKLEQFVDKYNNPTSLLIVIYQGHSGFSIGSLEKLNIL